MTAKKKISPAEFEKIFEEGGEIIDYLDLENAVVCPPGTMPWTTEECETRRINIDFTERTIRQLDEEARLYGVPRQAIVKMIVVDELEKRRIRHLQAYQATR